MQHQTNSASKVETLLTDLHICAPIDSGFAPVSTPKDRAQITTLPVELLSRIFESGSDKREEHSLCADNTLQYWDRLVFHPLESLLSVDRIVLDGATSLKAVVRLASKDDHHSTSFRSAISLVCRQWYHVAITTPSLWTTIHLKSSRTTFEQLQEMMARCGDLPVHIYADGYVARCPPPIDPGRMESYSEKGYMTPFGCSGHRLASMHLRETSIHFCEPWILSLPNLTALELNDLDDHLSWAQMISMLRSAPALKKLSLRYTGPIGGSDGVDNDSTGGGSTSMRDGDHHTPISLLNLTDLALAEETPAFTVALLRALYIPSLKTLALDFLSGDHTSFLEQVTGPATVPSTSLKAAEAPYTGSLLSQLEHLHIMSLYWEGSDMRTLERFYDELKNLKSLQLYLADILTEKPDFLEFLQLLRPYRPVGQLEPTVRLPRLETLVISNHGDSETTEDVLEVVSRRRAAGFPLKNLYLEARPKRGLGWLETADEEL